MTSWQGGIGAARVRAPSWPRRLPAVVLACLAALLATLLAAAPSAGAETGLGLGTGPQALGGASKPRAPSDVIPGRYIVAYERPVGSVAAATDRRERAHGFRAEHRFRHALEGFSARLSASQADALRDDPAVDYVVADRRVRALGFVPLASGETAPTGVRRMLAASATTARQASDSGVAVIDTGIDLEHPDLNAVEGRNCVTPGASADDDEGHGTHVAGTIGARNDGAGVVGVAPGTRLYAVKVLDATGSGSWSQVICGIDWVTAHTDSLGIDVANMSLGGLGENDHDCGRTDDDPLHQAVCRSTSAGVTHVVAAGNDAWDIGDSPPDVPASYPEVLTVTAMSDTDGEPGGTGPSASCGSNDSDDAYASFSNYATREVDKAHVIAAPGVCITSTVPVGSGPGGTSYDVYSGTSMASPHVAGAVALCLGEGGAAGPCAGKTPAQIVSHMRAEAAAQTTADPAFGFSGDPSRPNKFGDYYGYLAHAGPDTRPPDTSITAGPTGATSATSAELSFAAGEPGATFECSLDSGAWEVCGSPKSYSALADGEHSFAVRATDLAGNTDPTPASRSWTVDTQPPSTSIASGPAALGNDSTPTFELASSEPGSSFQCRVDAAGWSACASPHTTAQLSDGAHVFEARAVDAAGNVDPASPPASRSFAIDTAAPDTAITFGPDSTTKDTHPSFEFESPATDADRFECKIDTGAWYACVSPHRTAELADGPHTFSVRAGDAAGNRDASPAARSFTVDTVTTTDPSTSGGTDDTTDSGTADSGATDSTAAPGDGEAEPGGALAGLAQKRMLRVKRGRVAVKLGCAGADGCAGAMALKARLGRQQRRLLDTSRRALKLAKVRYSVSSGETKPLKPKLTRKARKLVRKQGKVPAKLILRGADGGRSKSQVKLRFRR